MNSSKCDFKHFAHAAALVVATLCFAAGSLRAQNTTGTIRGSVTGAGGAPIASAQIVARNTSTGATRNALSNDAGAYTLAAPVPGTYVFKVQTIASAAHFGTIVVHIPTIQV